MTYDYLKFGFYDCGDILIMKKKSLCNKHSQIQNEFTIPEKLFGCKNLYNQSSKYDRKILIIYYDFFWTIV